MTHKVTQKTVTLKKTADENYPLVDDIFQTQSQEIDLAHYEKLLESEQILVKLLYLSCDPSMRVQVSGAKTHMETLKPGSIMKGLGVAQVVKSKSEIYKEGDRIWGNMAWSKYQVLNAKSHKPIPDNYDRPYDFLGLLGGSGLTAHFGLEKIGQIKEGETVVVSAASGSVGMLVVQLAKLKNCKVIGITDTDQKCDYVIKTLKADHCININTQSLLEEIPKIAPSGIDIYFDNLGGKVLDEMLILIKDHARIILQGSISSQGQRVKYALENYTQLIYRKAIMQGFIVHDYIKEFPEAINKLIVLVTKGKLIFQEDFEKGLENASKGLQKLLLGKNEGKVIVDITGEY